MWTDTIVLRSGSNMAIQYRTVPRWGFLHPLLYKSNDWTKINGIVKLKRHGLLSGSCVYSCRPNYRLENTKTRNFISRTSCQPQGTLNWSKANHKNYLKHNLIEHILTYVIFLKPLMYSCYIILLNCWIFLSLLVSYLSASLGVSLSCNALSWCAGLVSSCNITWTGMSLPFERGWTRIMGIPLKWTDFFLRRYKHWCDWAIILCLVFLIQPASVDQKECWLISYLMPKSAVRWTWSRL